MPDIEKISVALTSEQVAELKAAVESGEYATTSEAVRDALRGWQMQRQLHEAEIQHLRVAWERGKASGPAVPVDMEELLQEARRRVKAKQTRRAA